MAYPEVSEEAVYLCTGNPTPSDVDALVGALFNASFADALTTISSLAVERGYALVDLVRACAVPHPPLQLCAGVLTAPPTCRIALRQVGELFRRLLSAAMPAPALAYLVDQLAQIE